ncbi:MAG TPA: ATP-binding protein [Chloroflexota bacterium]|nr:ATP-binding protein [Chloroflexota bacterium]
MPPIESNEPPPIPQSYGLLTAIWETATEAIAVSDSDGRVLMANPAYYALYGRSPEEVIGRSFALIFPIEQQRAAEAAYRETFTGDAPEGSVETPVQRADGTQLTVEARWHFLIEDDRRTAMVSLVLDVTERKRLEEAQRDTLAMIVHDLRTPLTAISGYAQVLQRRGGVNARILETILERSRVMQRLMNDLADVVESGLGRLPLQPSDEDLGALVQSVTEEVQGRTPDRRFELQLAPGALIGHWDRIRLGQVIENLLSNAVKYSPEGSVITVRAEDFGAEARVSVQDRGMGIPPDRLGAIFDRFYRLKEHTDTTEGWGLGLFISKELVEAHGGRLWAESAGHGQGSTFYFAIPYRAS